MIDIHCHILPGLDDGAKDMDEAVAMCRVAQADGIETLVATPHCRNGLYQNSEKTVLPALSQLKEHLESAGVDLTLLPGADIHIHPEIITFLKTNPRLLLGDRYFLLELPTQSVPPEIRDFFFKTQLAGYIPIITHPERNTVIQGQTSILAEWVIKSGVLVQVTAMSLTGAFGKAVEECAWQLIRSGLIQVIATDAHSPGRRPPLLSKAKRIIEEKVGPESARILLEDNPQKIITGKTVESIERIESTPRRSFFSWRRIFDRLESS